MRTVIFGVDGLTFRILRPLIERGDLPNFARLQREGATADFISTPASLTSPAWMSIATGLKPARHGVFDFLEYDAYSQHQSTKIVTRRKAGKAIWNILSECGKRVVVLNVPLTYPPEPVNGVMVSGMMTPGPSSPYTFPLSFKDELNEAVPDYCIDVAYENLPKEVLYDQVMQMTEKRIQLQEHLLTEHEWDFAFLCHVGPDRIQHSLWETIMTFSHEATRYYRVLDDALGRVIAHLSPNDLLFVVSDHGFVGGSSRFYINEYLRRRNLLQLTSSASYRARAMGFGHDVAERLHILNFARAIRKRYFDVNDRLTPVERMKEHYKPAIDNLNRNESKACAFSWSAFPGGYADIELSERASPDDVRELRDALSAMHHPESGEPLARAIHTTDDLGDGPFRPRQEHLIIVPSPGIVFHLHLGRKNLWEDQKEIMGHHEPEGVFYAWGAGIRPGVQIAPLQVYDLVPTVLHALDIPFGESFDGRVAQEIFAQKKMDHAVSVNNLVARKLQRLQEGK